MLMKLDLPHFQKMVLDESVLVQMKHVLKMSVEREDRGFHGFYIAFHFSTFVFDFLFQLSLFGTHLQFIILLQLILLRPMLLLLEDGIGLHLQDKIVVEIYDRFFEPLKFLKVVLDLLVLKLNAIDELWYVLQVLVRCICEMDERLILKRLDHLK